VRVRTKPFSRSYSDSPTSHSVPSRPGCDSDLHHYPNSALYSMTSHTGTDANDMASLGLDTPRNSALSPFFWGGSTVLYCGRPRRALPVEPAFEFLLQEPRLDYFLVLVLCLSTPSVLSPMRVRWSHMCMTQAGTRIGECSFSVIDVRTNYFVVKYNKRAINKLH
jgi:hypothetical protein